MRKQTVNHQYFEINRNTIQRGMEINLSWNKNKIVLMEADHSLNVQSWVFTSTFLLSPFYFGTNID